MSELFPLACGLLLGALLAALRPALWPPLVAACAALGMLAARHVRAPHRGRS